MRIDISDPAVEARLRKQIEASGESLEQVIQRLLETQEEQDRWLFEAIDSDLKIGRGLDQLDRGVSIAGREARERLQKRKEVWMQEHPEIKS